MDSQSTEMKSASLKSAFKAGIIRNISEVRENETGYLFVTLLGSGGKATNVYLGKKSAEQVAEGDRLTPDQLANAEIVLASNEEGEARIKLSLTGESTYTNLSTIFGDIESDYEKEVLTALKKDMTAREDATPQGNAQEEEDEEALAIAEAKALRAQRKLAGTKK